MPTINPTLNHEARKAPAAKFSRLQADLLLVHAPACFDFRERRDIYFPFLGTSGDVPITPLYEYFPVGFKSLQRFLTGRDHDVKIINLSTIFLRYPKTDLDALLESLDVRLLGIDLHWMVHVQGSLAIAERIKQCRPDIRTIFGGISSTYYHEQLIQYPFIDMVMLGYDTHEPMDALLRALKREKTLEGVPNLTWKDADGRVQRNVLSHLPNTFSCGIDWSKQPEQPSTKAPPIREVLSMQNAGCAYNCGWCGGSREAFRRIYKRKRAMARKPREEIRYELETTKTLAEMGGYHYYSVGSYNEPKAGMSFFLDQVKGSNFKSISYEQYHLTSDEMMKQMVAANKRTIITLSPESHDLKIAKLSGRGVYANDEMERWLERALDHGIYHIDIWYFIGMPEQDEASVMGTLEYCAHLLEKFQGRSVNPMLCPMIPFLDPASTFFEFPEANGYKVFYRTVEEHRQAMTRASIINRTNYETKWLDREELVTVGFKAVKQLMEMKAHFRALPQSMVNDYNAKIDDALEFIPVVHEADCIQDPKARAKELDGLGDEILKRNDMVFFSGVMNQAYPINRDIGGRWFDELGWAAEEFEPVQSA